MAKQCCNYYRFYVISQVRVAEKRKSTFCPQEGDPYLLLMEYEVYNLYRNLFELYLKLYSFQLPVCER